MVKLVVGCRKFQGHFYERVIPCIKNGLNDSDHTVKDGNTKNMVSFQPHNIHGLQRSYANVAKGVLRRPRIQKIFLLLVEVSHRIAGIMSSKCRGIFCGFG